MFFPFITFLFHPSLSLFNAQLSLKFVNSSEAISTSGGFRIVKRARGGGGGGAIKQWMLVVLHINSPQKQKVGGGQK